MRQHHLWFPQQSKPPRARSAGAEHFHHARKRKIHRAQAEDGEDIGCVDDECVPGNRRIAGIESTAKAGRWFPTTQHHQQRRGEESGSANEEFVSFVVFVTGTLGGTIAAPDSFRMDFGFPWRNNLMPLYTRNAPKT